MALNVMEKHLFRSRDSYVGGVCAGIAEYYGLDALVVRILAIILCLVTLGLAAIVYLVMWVYVPLEPEKSRPVDVLPESALLYDHGPVEYLVVQNDQGEDEWVRLPIRGLSIGGRIAVFSVLALLSAALAAVFMVLLPGTRWWQYLPVLTLILGLFLIVVPIRSRVPSAWMGAGIMAAAASAAAIPMSLGFISWSSLAFALQLFWPIVAVAALLYASGVVRNMGALVMAGAACFVVFCVCGVLMCSLPGRIELLAAPYVINIPGLVTV